MNINNKKEELHIRYKRLLREIKSYKKVYIFGTTYEFELNNVIRELEKDGIIINAIVDDYLQIDKVKNYPVIKSNELDPNSIVISTVTGERMWTVIKLIEDLKVSKIITYWDLILSDITRFELPEWFKDNFIEIENNIKEYEILYKNLEDKESRDTLNTITDFRYNLDINSMKSFVDKDISKPYFEDFFPVNEVKTFVDCGGYDGKTTLDFISCQPEYEKIYYFEPSEKNMDISKCNLKDVKNIDLHCQGTYSENLTLKFSSEKGQSSAISEQGENIIEVIKLDDIIQGEKILIKMDIEGSEYESIKGAESLIRNKKPYLAICVYHNQKDFLRIPRLIKEYNEDYKIYLRHYGQGYTETVMFFV